MTETNSWTDDRGIEWVQGITESGMNYIMQRQTFNDLQLIDLAAIHKQFAADEDLPAVDIDTTRN